VIELEMCGSRFLKGVFILADVGKNPDRRLSAFLQPSKLSLCGDWKPSSRLEGIRGGWRKGVTQRRNL
jgi:hypothetical protein